jgi:hypothetical protein
VGVDPQNTEFIKDPTLKIRGMANELIRYPGTSEGTKRQLRQLIENQKGFRFKDKGGREVKIVICPVHDGFELWFLGPKGSGIQA